MGVSVTVSAANPTAGAVPAPLPDDEEQRLADLHGYEILDTDPEDEFDAIARLAADVCGTSMARVNLIDRSRQWTKAVIGMNRDETHRDVAFCAHTILSPNGVMVVEDALEDHRFAGNPLVADDPGIRFYAGSTIRSDAGRALGAVCVIDTEPRSLTPQQERALGELSRVATTQLELRRLLTSERRLVDDLRLLDRKKAEFSASVVHDFRTPLTAIVGYADLLRDEHIPPDDALDAIERGAGRLLELVDELAAAGTDCADESLDFACLVETTAALLEPLALANDVAVSTSLAPAHMRGDRVRLTQVIENLVGNAIKYSPRATVDVRVECSNGRVTLEVADTGVGIPEAELPRLFERFFRASTSASFEGTGVGLATVKSIVDALGGTVSVRSAVGRGTTVVVALPA